MDPFTNPFAPGAGTPPPELAGRDRILADANIALGRVKNGLPARSQMLLGLRGVGKTVLLNSISELAKAIGFSSIELESPEERPIAEMLVPPLRGLLLKLSRIEKCKDVAQKGMGVLRSFAGAFKIEVGEVAFGVQSEVGTADSGILEFDLPELMLAVATAAKAGGRPIAILIDEVQYLNSKDLSALISSIHKIGQKGLPLVMFGAGLPQLAGLVGEAKSYAERLFSFPDVGPLNQDASMAAIVEPLKRHGVRIEPDALASIVEKTKGYPYFLQEWGHHAWNSAMSSPITSDDVERATSDALMELDNGFFLVRLGRLTPREKEYMRAMASLGPGPHRSGEIAQGLSMSVTKAGPLRNGLIKKGMIFSRQHGDTEFTVPMFDEFMRRSVPDWTGLPTSPTDLRRARRPKRDT